MCVLKEIPLATFKRQAVQKRPRRHAAHARAPPHRVDRETKRDDYGDGPYESITINLPVDLAGSLGNLCHLHLSGRKAASPAYSVGPVAAGRKIGYKNGNFLSKISLLPRRHMIYQNIIFPPLHIVISFDLMSRMFGSRSDVRVHRCSVHPVVGWNTVNSIG